MFKIKFGNLCPKKARARTLRSGQMSYSKKEKPATVRRINEGTLFTAAAESNL
jgi:hypothetical protein